MSVAPEGMGPDIKLNRWYKLEAKAFIKWAMYLEKGRIEVKSYPGREKVWRVLVLNPRRKAWQRLGVDPSEPLFVVVDTGTESSMEKAGEKALASYRKYIRRGIPKMLFNPALVQSWDRMTKLQRVSLLRLIGVLPEAAENLAKHSWATLAPVVKMKLSWAWKENRVRRNDDPRFEALAEAQRDRPEAAGFRIGMAQLSQLYGSAVEHVGDLTHRMSQKIGFFKGGYPWVGEKVRKTLRWLTNAYGFEREVREQVVKNFHYYKERGELPKHFGRSPQDALIRLKRLGRLYAAEHRKLPVFNAVQRIARDAAIAVGEWRFKHAVDRLYALKYLLDQGHEAWSREAMKTRNNSKRRVRRNINLPSADIFEASPYGLTPNSRRRGSGLKTYYVARFRPPYPQRGEFWTANEMIDLLPATVVGHVYKVSAPTRALALAEAKAAHGRGK